MNDLPGTFRQVGEAAIDKCLSFEQFALLLVKCCTVVMARESAFHLCDLGFIPD